MRIASAFLACISLLLLSAQDGAPMDERVVAANATVTALAKAQNDPQRDSLNLVLQRQLKELLQEDIGPSVLLNGLELSQLYPYDKSFHLITWNLPRENGSYHYEGLLLQLKGKQRIIHELQDKTSEITSPEVPELGPDRWYGALYYEVVPVKRGGKTYYTLLGWKGHDRVETRKVIDVLHFKGSQPKFGAPVFGSGKLRKTRQVFGYSFQATMTLRYEAAQGMIVLDHLSPARADLEGQYAFYGPDMSYDAYIWDKDHWRFERDIDARDRTRNNKPFNAPPPQPRP